MKAIGFVNGSIYESWRDPASAEALVVMGARVAWTGARADLPAVDTIVDLQGAVLGPGLTDAHSHFLIVANSRLETRVDQSDVKSIHDVFEKLKQSGDKRPVGDWVIASGFDENRLVELRYPTRVEIDRVFPDRPVLIRRVCNHVVIVNSPALAALGNDDSIKDPPGGVFSRDGSGRLDGSAREAAAGLITLSMPRAARDRRIFALEETLQHGAALGMVAGVEAALGGRDGGRFDEEVGIWDELRRKHERLPMRLGFMYCLDAKEMARRRLAPRRDPHFQGMTLKFFADGIMGARTAAVSQPYVDGTGNGIFVRDEAELKRALIDAHCDGWQIAVHAVGDRAISLVIDAYREGQRICPRSDARHRIEHASLSTPHDYAEMKRLGISIVTQPSFLSRMNRSKRSAFGDRVHGYY